MNSYKSPATIKEVDNIAATADVVLLGHIRELKRKKKKTPKEAATGIQAKKAKDTEVNLPFSFLRYHLFLLLFSFLYFQTAVEIVSFQQETSSPGFQAAISTSLLKEYLLALSGPQGTVSSSIVQEALHYSFPLPRESLKYKTEKCRHAAMLMFEAATQTFFPFALISHYCYLFWPNIIVLARRCCLARLICITRQMTSRWQKVGMIFPRIGSRSSWRRSWRRN